MNQAQSVGGYTCQRCGWWVPSGVVHTCGNSAPTPSVPITAMPSEQRQVAALERIATALERIADVASREQRR